MKLLFNKFTFGCILLVIIVVTFNIAGKAIPEQDKAEYDRLVHQSTVKENGKSAVRSLLKDPESARFSRVSYSNKSGEVACGLVNAKNALGGYTGDQLFISAGFSGSTFLEKNTDNFNSLWEKYCS